MAEWLIQQQEIERLHQGADDGHPLLLAVRTDAAFGSQLVADAQPFGHFLYFFDGVEGVQLPLQFNILQYGLFGEKARRIFPVAIGVLFALSFLPSLLTLSLGAFNFSWLLWVFILFWLGNVRTQPLDDITPLDGKRRALGFFMLVLFILLFTPIPMVTY